jgi:large subunit ribosomal protein L6
MSRKGKQPIPIPKGVEVKTSTAGISVKGPKGTLNHNIMEGLKVHVGNQEVQVALEDENSDLGHFHGLYRAIVNNMIHGVSEGYEIRLEMIGVGYRAAVQGHNLDLQIGTSHPVKLEIPNDIHVKVEKNTLIIITGADKQRVGQFAASARAKKPPEPYQGKGIRYVGEYVRKKAGKAAAKKTA